MADLDRAISKLSFIQSNLNNIAVDALRMSSDLAVKLQQSQMLLGLNADGEEIGGYRSLQYEMMKQQMNPSAGGAVDLKLTGAFHRAIKLEINSEFYRTISTDEKTGDLVGKYGKSIFGFNKNSRITLDKKINENFKIQIKKIL